MLHSIRNSMHASASIKNKGFALLDETFRRHGWYLQQNEMNWIRYGVAGDETSYFDIRITSDRITVSVPVKRTMYQYVVTFKEYFDASEYVEQRFFDYIAP